MMALTGKDGKLLLRNGALASGAGCCCEAACDCCPGEDYFIEFELIPGDTPEDFDEERYWELSRETGGNYTVDQWLADNGASRKEDAPDRQCLDKAIVYGYVRATGYVSEPCNFQLRLRVYVPDCSTETLVDITSDYNEPVINEDGEYAFFPVRLGFWEWGKASTTTCDNAGFTLPPWLDRDPLCNPLP